MYNLTVNIEAADYTNLKQPFTVSLSTTLGLPAYRIYPNGQEVFISNTTADQVIQTSDENYQVVLKFQGPNRFSLYGAFIEYQIASNYNENF